MLILIKSEGQFKRSGRYFLMGGRWHALHHDATAPKQHAAAPEPVHVPEFQEGKTVTGVKAYYEGVAQKLMDAAAGGDVSALEAMKAKGLTPNAKGKVSNTWAGRTENSKLLLGLYDRIVAHIQGGAKHAAIQHLEQDEKQSDIPSGEKKEDKQTVAKLKQEPPAQAVDAALDHLKEDEGQSNLPAAEKKQDAGLFDKLEGAKGLKTAPPNVAKLRAGADTLEEKATAEINRDRLANTSRRASMAASAIASAEKDAAIARTMRNLANAIESGKSQHLSGIGTRSAVEELDRSLTNAMFESDRSLSYSDKQKKKGRAPEPDDIRNAKLPRPSWGSGGADRPRLLDDLKGKRGAKALMDNIRSSAGPNAEILSGLKKYLSDKEIDYRVGWWNREAVQRLSRLSRIGINTDNELRLALTEYVIFRDGARKEDPVKAAERAIVGQKVGVDFFPTPKPLAERMTQLAGVKPGDRVLEPSAGNGNLADAAKAAGASVDTVEVSDALRNVLNAKGHALVGRDFNDYQPSDKYDAVIMNPPFSDRKDAAHIMRAWDMVKPGGKLVAIAGEGVFFGSDQKAQAFRDWLDEHGADVEKLPAGTFQDKSLLATTGANARLIVMHKPAGSASAENEGPKEGEKNAEGLVFRNGRWHREDQEPVKNAEPSAATASESSPAASVEPIKKEPRLILPQKKDANPSGPDKPELHRKLDMVPWDSIKAPAENKNSKSHNRQVDRIKAAAYAGDLATLEAMKFGTNTYGRRQEKLKQVAIAALRESPKLAEIDAAAHEAATSPHNDKAAPTEAQVKAGNYEHGHVKVSGLDVTIENPRGSVRSGKRPDGSTWEHTMSDHYGYIKRTTGADGEHVDVYVGPHVDSDRVYIIDQLKDGKSGFDEHKVMLGFSSKDEAVAAYRSNFDEGWKVGPVTEMSVDEFKSWLKDGDTTKPVASAGPQEGERNAEGLVFRNGRWHRDEEPAAPTLSNYTEEMAGKARTKRAFVESVIGRFSSEKSSNEDRQALFDALGLSKGVKMDEFKDALERFYDSKRDERKSRRLDDKQAQAESNVRQVMNQARAIYQQDQETMGTPDDALSDDPNSPNYRFKDTGYIAGSRKEAAAESIRRAARSGTMVRSTDIDWGELENNPREARELIKKSNLFGKVDWTALREAGMTPGAGFLIDRVYASVATEPDRDSPQKRQDYAMGLESLRERMETCKSPDEVVDTLNQIREELEGSILTEEQAQAYSGLMEVYSQKREVARQAKEVSDAYYQAWNLAQIDLNSLEYQQKKRIRRGWKPDPELQKQIDSLRSDEEKAHQKYLAYREDHPELENKQRNLDSGWTTYENDLEWEASQYRRKAQDMMKAVRAANMMNNPVTRAWVTLGPKFLAVLNYRRSKGSDAFAGHVTNARNGKITDWSWAEKEGATVKRATKREVSFQLKVAENYERKGGREVSVASTAEFKDKFGLRDVQSGNWVLNDPNSAAWHVQKSTEAFADLADILGATDKDVSMNGRLAMAFGARGRGNAGFGGAARAHYESIQRVINLTKMGGGGTLAHEWAHSLDNLCVEAENGKPGGAKEYASETPDLLPAGELREAFKAVRAAMLEGDVQAGNVLKYSASDVKMADYNIDRVARVTPVAGVIKQAGSVQAAVKAVDDYFGDTTNMTPKWKKRVNDWRRVAVAYYDRNPEGGEAIVKAGPGMSSFAAEAAALDGGRSTEYWSKTREMFARAFQSYVEDKLEAAGRRNDYLSAMADNKYYRDPMFGDQKPFPEGEERKRINAAFDKLVAAMQKSGTLEKAMQLLN